MKFKFLQTKAAYLFLCIAFFALYGTPKLLANAASSNSLAFALYEFLYGENSAKCENFAFSPTSISETFSMALLCGECSENLDGESGCAISESFSEKYCMKDKSADGVCLENYIVGDDGSFPPLFCELVKKRYKARKCSRPEFLKVAGKNSEIFKNVNTPLQITGGGALFASVCRMNCKWLEIFDGGKIAQGRFRIPTATAFKICLVDYMTGKLENAKLVRLEKFDVLEMFYKNTPLSMIIAVEYGYGGTKPAKFGLQEFNLACEMLERQKYGKRVYVRIPRFKISSEVAAITPAFEKICAKQSGIRLGKFSAKMRDFRFVQSCNIDVNETGTIAESVSCAFLAIETFDTRAEHFRADKPFLFFIADTHARRIFFMGTVRDPSNGNPPSATMRISEDFQPVKK